MNKVGENMKENQKEIFVYEIPKYMVNNILTFLNRADYSGFTEAQAVLEIVNVLNKPIEEKIITVE